MKQIWCKACTHFDVPEQVANIWYERIYQRLNEVAPLRAYHNWCELLMRKQQHLQHCQPNIVLAAFFQYYNYDGNRNCVKDNCAAFKEFCYDAQIDDEESKNSILKLLGDVPLECELLPASYEDDANLLQDLDLLVLAATAEDYKHYKELLRREYQHMNDESYKLMRLRVLETLLHIPSIFATAEFQTQYEQKARENIRQEITEIKASIVN